MILNFFRTVKIVVGDYDFRLKVKTVVGDYSFIHFSKLLSSTTVLITWQ